MIGIRHLNIDKAINTFLKNVEKLSRLPFITDEEMTLVYGEEVTENLIQLANYSRKEKVCSNCASKCCPLVKCELYYPGFSQCPIYPYRPALCRMHFCEQFPLGDISFVREFADIFLNSLIEARQQGNTKVLLFDAPPLAKQVPKLVATVIPWIDAVKLGTLNEASARALIQAAIEKYRIPV